MSGAPSRDLVHRAIGAVVGAAVGDAVGAPFEFRPAGTYRARFPEPVVGGIGEMIGGGGFGWAPGEFTDDTQMAMMVAASLLAEGQVDQDDLDARFRAWFTSGPVDVGASTSWVLSGTEPCVDRARRHHEDHPTRSGNGSLMRTIPAAVFFARESSEATMAAARAISAVTHAHPEAQAGCAIYHELVRIALDGGDPLEGIDAAVAAQGEAGEAYVDRLAPGWAPSATTSNGGVWDALATAVWALRRADSFEEAVVLAVDSGDDADTVGAITGGLAGAVWGAGAIPCRWSTYVHGTVIDTTYRLADLQDIARRLVGAQPVPLQEDEPVLGPTEVRSGLWLANLAGARTTPPETAVISLCRPQGAFADHPVRRELYLVDQEGRHNPALAAVVDDLVATIEAFRAEGRDVVIHCHGGRSRTGLAFRAWLTQVEGLGYEAAQVEAQRVWPATATYNATFEEALRALAG